MARVNAAQLCGCSDKQLVSHEDAPIVYDMGNDAIEEVPLTAATWPAGAGASYANVTGVARATRAAMEAELHPKPDPVTGAGTCTDGLPGHSRQPCCPGCAKHLFGWQCKDKSTGKDCTCDTLGSLEQTPRL